MRLRPSVLLALVCAVVLAPSAGAREVNAPPGNSGVDEYLETVPGGGGSQPTNRDPGRSQLSPAARKKLDARGADGRAAAELAERVDPASTGQATQPIPARVLPRGDGGGGVLGALGSALSGGDDGSGIWLPILLVLATAAAVVVALRRRVSRL
jgi:hypothetical protein